MTRQMIIDATMNAHALKECRSAETQLLDWLNAHPEDVSLHEIAGLLGIVKSAAQEREATIPLRQGDFAQVDLTELVSCMPPDYEAQEESFGKPVGKEEW